MVATLGPLPLAGTEQRQGKGEAATTHGAAPVCAYYGALAHGWWWGYLLQLLLCFALPFGVKRVLPPRTSCPRAARVLNTHVCPSKAR